MAEIFNKDVPIQAPDFKVKNRTGITRTKRTGGVLREMVVAEFNPSANTGERTVAAHGLGVFIPAKAVVTRVWIDVVTTFTSAGADAGTIALHLQSANDVVSAIAISDASNVWDAGIHGSKIGFPALADTGTQTALEVAALFAGSMLKMTAERELTATVATQALTAGKANIYVEYVISD
jgi:hypothetical protein